MDQNVGSRDVDVADVVQGALIAIRFLYPTQAPERSEPFGPFVLPVAKGAPVGGNNLPLVLVSHGSGGTPWTHRDLAAHLARSGFVVALLQHPGNHRGDDSLSGTAINLQNRPRHVRLTIDAAFADPVLGARLSRDTVAIIGHSMGGYTGLAVAGGNPACPPWETADGRAGPLAVEHDPRVAALVLLAPATSWFMADGALKDVRVPILMRTGGEDTLTDRSHADVVEQGLSDRRQLDHQMIPGAGHFAFLSSYPDQVKSASIPPSQDPEGFDRLAFLPVLFRDIVGFLRRNLRP